MINKEKEDIILSEIKRAESLFNEAQFQFSNQLYNTAVNRLYYSCYHAVSALLLEKDIKTKRHSGVIQMFGLHFVSTGIIQADTGKFYTQLIDLRQVSDYKSDFDFEENDVNILLEPARKLISQIQQILSD